MNFYRKKISAYMLLGVFVLAFLNSVLPHTHHSHNTDAFVSVVAESVHKHSHDGHHHHHNQEEKDTKRNNALDELHTSEHSHQSHLHELPLITLNKVKKQQLDSDLLLFSNTFLNFSKGLIGKRKPLTFYKGKPYKNLHPLSTPLRGPPVLG